jgi:hypothetical protein
MMLNESIAPRAILSEGLEYHLNNGKPLTEQLYRAGSSSYFNLWAEARALYSRGIIEVYGDDKEIITETHLGEFGILEDGTRVPLDFPIEEDITEAKNENKKDRTTPSYWSCRIGRYWKQLGGDKNFSGFW